ncbi:helix-turn-helix domain-containing protein [Mangrovicoccus algicola]|uniref:Winged helix-turn-helix domain-containing protein n=1 Tax=Mangrovicoccus algicola TaxID=2771008 RepID=A0A8J6YTQ1_9RHOB|nr:hypothetical protein [Mangrovicoccus algicola]MBE3637342.1 hypothetical protein [Mangrovicoccus algicola]
MPYDRNGIGHAPTDTSAATAAMLGKQRPTHLRDRVMAALSRAEGPLTADEIAERIGVDFMSIRPRLTELKAKKRVRDSGERGPSRSGRPSIKWQIAKDNARERKLPK